jgi:hypothetical protein
MINFLVEQLHLKTKHMFLSNYEGYGDTVSFSKENIEETFEALWNAVIFDSENPKGDVPEEIIESCEKEGIPELFWPLICAAGLAKFSLIKNRQGDTGLAIDYLCLAEFSAGIWVTVSGLGKILSLGETSAASLLAKKRHAKEKNEFKEVIKYWRENIYPSHPFLSASKAADRIKMVDISPLSHRKLVELIAAEKKKSPESLLSAHNGHSAQTVQSAHKGCKPVFDVKNSEPCRYFPANATRFQVWPLKPNPR